MTEQDVELARRVRDILAVASDDIDAVISDVEDGVAYIEGVVPTEEQRRAIINTVRQLDGVQHVVACLVTEHVPPLTDEQERPLLYPAPVLMHYSLS